MAGKKKDRRIKRKTTIVSRAGPGEGLVSPDESDISENPKKGLKGDLKKLTVSWGGEHFDKKTTWIACAGKYLESLEDRR